MGILNKLKRLFETCEQHIWRFAGTGLGKALVPEWIFKCETCGTKVWKAEGCFQTQESYDFYKDKMNDDFKDSWLVANKAENEEHLFRIKREILAGTYFE